MGLGKRRVERQRPVGERPGAGRVVHVDVGQRESRIRSRVARVPGDRFGQVPDRLAAVAFEICIVAGLRPPDVQVECFRIGHVRRREPCLVLRGECDLDRLGNGQRHLPLERHRVAPVALELFAPHRRTPHGVDEARRDPDARAVLPHRPIHEVFHAEHSRDIRRRPRRQLELQHRLVRDDAQPFDLRQRAGELIGHPVGEVFLVAARVVPQRQDGQRECLDP